AGVVGSGEGWAGAPCWGAARGGSGGRRGSGGGGGSSAGGGRRRTFNDSIVDALKELGVDRGVIGVCGLQPDKYNLMRVPDGVVGSNLMDLIRETFPQARIVSATPVNGHARMTNSAEEIAVLERSTATARAGLH